MQIQTAPDAGNPNAAIWGCESQYTDCLIILAVERRLAHYLQQGCRFTLSEKGEEDCYHCVEWTVWPSGLRRWLQAPVRKGVGSNPTAVISSDICLIPQLLVVQRMRIVDHIVWDCKHRAPLFSGRTSTP